MTDLAAVIEQARRRLAPHSLEEHEYEWPKDWARALLHLWTEREKLQRELAIFRRGVPVHLDADNCTHNVEIDPDTGECGTCGTVLP